MARIDELRSSRLTHTADAAGSPRETLRRLASQARATASRVPWSIRQVLLVLALVAAYFFVRGLTEGAYATAVRHARDIERLESALRIDVETRLQSAASRSDPLIDVANWIYVWGHWPVIVATLVWLLLRHRERYLRLRDAMAISGALGMVIFVSYPVAPPRLVTDGLVDTVTERSSAYRFLQPPAFVDRYAAMPSLHVGWDLLVGIAIVTTAGVTLVRVAGWLLPPLMALAVVITANHYVLDVVVGVAIVLVGHAAALWLERRRERRRELRGGAP